MLSTAGKTREQMKAEARLALRKALDAAQQSDDTEADS